MDELRSFLGDEYQDFNLVVALPNGRPFLPEGRQAYCSDACKAEGNRRRSRERMRKKRLKNG